MRGIETFIDSVMDRLASDLPAALARQANAARGYRDVVLAMPTLRDRLTVYEQAFPVLSIYAGQATPEEQTSRWVTRYQELFIAIEDRRDTDAHLARALMRYETAVMEAMLSGAPPYPAHTLRWARSTPGPLFIPGQPVDGPAQSYTEMMFTAVLTEEDVRP